VPGKIKRTKPIMAKKRSENTSPDYSNQNTSSPVSHVAKTSMITPPPKLRARGLTTGGKPEKNKIENKTKKSERESSEPDSSATASVQQSHQLEKIEAGYNVLPSPERKLIKPINLSEEKNSLDNSLDNQKLENRVNTEGDLKLDEQGTYTLDGKSYNNIDHITEETPKHSNKKSAEKDPSSRNLSIDIQNSKSDNSLGARKSISIAEPKVEVPKLPLSKKSSIVSSKRPSQTYADQRIPPEFIFEEETKMDHYSIDAFARTQPKIGGPILPGYGDSQAATIERKHVRSQHASGRKSIDLGFDERTIAQQMGETQDLEKLTQAMSKHAMPNKKQPNQPILIDIKALVESLKCILFYYFSNFSKRSCYTNPENRTKAWIC
jgi:hypothetical protein